jgi:sugar/nucleoside kinase (ribokinase family)
MIWDTIHGRDLVGAPAEEWGGIGYTLAALDAALPPGWQVMPLVKVGRDLADRAHAFLRQLGCVAQGARFVEVPGTNPRVTLRYVEDDRRCEGLVGGVPPWTWAELGPMVLGLDALYCNFITGFECDLATVRSLRRAYHGPLYGDLHSLALGIAADGTRYYRPIEEALAWLTVFDVAQVNEAEMAQLGPEPLALAARALEQDVGAVCVTLGPRGTIYVAAGDFAGFAWAGGARPPRGPNAALVKTALVRAEGEALRGDPTGCGDVFGATLVAHLLGEEALEAAVGAANRMARRNVTYRGATGLQHHLRGAIQGAGAA